jgi:hypothetical protein
MFFMATIVWCKIRFIRNVTSTYYTVGGAGLVSPGRHFSAWKNSSKIRINQSQQEQQNNNDRHHSRATFTEVNLG